MSEFFADENLTLHCGDALATLRGMGTESVQCVVTSPPYWGLRDYGVCGQIGHEKSVEDYVNVMTELFREVRRVLKADGTLWVTLGDSYICNLKGSSGSKSKLSGGEKTQMLSGIFQKESKSLSPKNLVGAPWRIAFALQADGWYLRSDIIWEKPNQMPSSVRDRPTKSHEYIFLFTKSSKYFYNAAAIAEPLTTKPETWGSPGRKDHGMAGIIPRPMFGKKRNWRDGKEWGNGKTRNKRSVWRVSTVPFCGSHFAAFPPKLIEPCILAGSRPGDIILDPFFGSGTTGMVSLQLGRKCVGIELKADYCDSSLNRIFPTRTASKCGTVPEEVSK